MLVFHVSVVIRFFGGRLLLGCGRFRLCRRLLLLLLFLLLRGRGRRLAKDSINFRLECDLLVLKIDESARSVLVLRYRFQFRSELEEEGLKHLDLVVDQISVLFLQMSNACHLHVGLLLVLLELSDRLFPLIVEAVTIPDWHADSFDGLETVGVIL